MKFGLSFVTGLSLLGASLFAGPGHEVVVLTQNQYLGADLSPLLTASDPAAQNAAALAILAQVTANNFPERALELAKQIAAQRPHLVALQEVLNFKLNGQNGLPPFRDHLADTMAALTALGEQYLVAASVQNANLAIPLDITGDLLPDVSVEVTDRDVILVRADIAASTAAVPFSLVCAEPSADSGPGCNFVARTSDLVPRGFVAVDATIDGKDYRFVNTHLEIKYPIPGNPLSSVIQSAQAFELIQLLAATTPSNKSLIIAGDMNSSQEDQVIPAPTPIVPPYIQFVAAGLTDAWTLRPGNVPGYTCCQQPDLLNHHSNLAERIDLIFSAEIPNKTKARVLGDTVADKTRPSRLWPSDHGAVVAEFRFE
jgi:endonuclease/exonuclease/phosphatase family metal-dependent hydrolase